MDRRYRPLWLLHSSSLEALGWWAGWYGEQVDTTPAAKGSLATKSCRYVVYLDGIGQSTLSICQIFKSF